VLGVLFVLLSLNALSQGAARLAGASHDPTPLAALQLCIGVAALAAAWGSFQLRRWAPLAALAHGVITSAMLVSLESMLDLPRESRGGLWSGATVILAFDVWAAWYLRRLAGRAR
jgi:hypothetical protein